MGRLQLPVVLVILNNNGIGTSNPTEFTLLGDDQPLEGTAARLQYPSKSLIPSAHYELLATAFGGTGIFVHTADALEDAFKNAVAIRPFKPTIINCMIDTAASRGKKAVSFIGTPQAPTAKL